MDRSYQKQRSSKENKNHMEMAAKNQKQTAESLGTSHEDEGLENLIFTGYIEMERNSK